MDPSSYLGRWSTAVVLRSGQLECMLAASCLDVRVVKMWVGSCVVGVRKCILQK